MKQQKTLEKRRIFSERLSKLVTERGTQLNHLAAAVGVGDSAVTQWLSQMAGCKGSNLAKVAEYFNVPIEYLTGAIDYVPSRPRPLRENEESIDAWRLRAIRAEERLEAVVQYLNSASENLRAEARRIQIGHVSDLPLKGSDPSGKRIKLEGESRDESREANPPVSQITEEAGAISDIALDEALRHTKG